MKVKAVLFLFQSFIRCVILCQFQTEPEAASSAHLTLHSEISLMEQQNILYNRQTQTGSHFGALVEVVDLIIALPHQRQFLLGNSDACVDDL